MTRTNWDDDEFLDADTADQDDDDEFDEDGFNYEQFVAQEFGDSPISSQTASWVQWTVMVVLAAMSIPILMAVLL